MKKGALVEATIFLVSKIVSSKKKTKIIISNYIKKNRYIGSKDKKYIYNLTFNTLKKYHGLLKVCEENLIPKSIRNITLLNVFNKYKKGSYEEYFIGKYSLNEKKEDRLIFEIASSINEEIQPKFPNWLETEVNFNEDKLNNIYSAILKEPKFDIAVNRSVINRDRVKKKLDDLSFTSRKTTISPFGITINKRIPENELKKNKKNFFEVQDEGSQIITQIIDINKKIKVLDMCAGKGTKTVFLNNTYGDIIDLYAYDISKSRLNVLKKRKKELKLNKLKIVQNLSNYKNYFDLIICDVPCSGTGVWRRFPENIIRLTKKQLDSFIKSQLTILIKASHLCKINGEIAYITCSLIDKENKLLILKFLENKNNFKLIDIKNRVNKILSQETCGNNTNTFTLTPDMYYTDGFFIGILKKEYNFDNSFAT